MNATQEDDVLLDGKVVTENKIISTEGSLSKQNISTLDKKNDIIVTDNKYGDQNLPILPAEDLNATFPLITKENKVVGEKLLATVNDSETIVIENPDIITSECIYKDKNVPTIPANSTDPLILKEIIYKPDRCCEEDLPQNNNINYDFTKNNEEDQNITSLADQEIHCISSSVEKEVAENYTEQILNREIDNSESAVPDKPNGVQTIVEDLNDNNLHTPFIEFPITTTDLYIEKKFVKADEKDCVEKVSCEIGNFKTVHTEQDNSISSEHNNSCKHLTSLSSELNVTGQNRNSPSILLEISVGASPNELDKTTSCIEESDIDLEESPVKTNEYLNSNVTTTILSEEETSDTNKTLSPNESPAKFSSSDVSLTNNSSVAGILFQVESTDTKSEATSPLLNVNSTVGSSKLFNNCSKDSFFTDSTESIHFTKQFPKKDLSSTTSPLIKNPRGECIAFETKSPVLIKNSKVSPVELPLKPLSTEIIKYLGDGDNQNKFVKNQTFETNFGPDSNFNFKMTDLVDKLNQQQAENSDLKLKLNASQQHIASLELQIRQHEEIVIKAQAEALKSEQNFQQEIKQLKHKLNENSKIIDKDRIQELEEQLKEGKAREAKLLAEISQRTKDVVNFQKIMSQYDETFKQRISEYKKLQEENETIKTHLANLESAFSDVHSKYEKAKAVLLCLKANEETLLHSLEIAQSTNIQHEERYESLKAHATTQIEKANKENHDIKEQHEIEISKLRAIMRRLEIKVSSLEVSLQQKTEECEQLSALCDEVTGKKV